MGGISTAVENPGECNAQANVSLPEPMPMLPRFGCREVEKLLPGLICLEVRLDADH